MAEPKPVGFEEAVAQFSAARRQGKKAWAILYRPRECNLVYLDQQGRLRDHDRSITPTDVYEARIFDADAELRWVRGADGLGVPVRITDDTHPPGDLLQNGNRIEQTYLIWGQRVAGAPNEKTVAADTKSSDGGDSIANGDNETFRWTRFGSARIGPLWVPVGLKKCTVHAHGATGASCDKKLKCETHARFTAVEYLTAYDQLDGNVAVSGERLTGIQGYSPE